MTVHDTIAFIVNAIRDPIAEIQEKQDISRTRRFTLVELITSLFNHTYNACSHVVLMLIGLLPLLHALLVLVRFILDKILEINDIESTGEKCFRSAIFLCEFFLIFVMVSFVYAILLYPILNLVLYAVYKVWGILNG